jgi:invasion protein IalB
LISLRCGGTRLRMPGAERPHPEATREADLSRKLSLAAVLLAATLGAVPALAQQEQQKPQQDTLKVKQGDWEVRCAPEGKPCYMTQVVQNSEGAPLMNVVIRKLPAESKATAVALFRAPLGVVLPRGVEMRIDGGEPITSPFVYCLGNGCFSEVAMTLEGLQKLQRGAAATLSIYSVQKPNDAVQVKLSLIGFTKAFDAVD